MEKFLSKQENDTRELGKKYGQKSQKGDVYLLTGELGGGKTQFTKGIAEGLGIAEEITSPTFTFERIYENKNGLNLYHFDLYRNETLDEDVARLIAEAEENGDGVVVIEWAERAEEIWPQNYRLIKFFWKGENDREIQITEK